MDGERIDLLAGVGGVVRRLREERGLSRRALSDKSGVSERFLADLEGGSGNISVVRLAEGDMDRATVYGDDPAAQAMLFAQAGAEYLHVVAPANTQGPIPRDLSIER